MLDEEGRPIELGHGAMGVTYKALDVDLRCPVAIKVISERYLGDGSARLRFLRETRAAASVRHPNIGSSLFSVGSLLGGRCPLSAALRLLKVESDINGILPAGGGPLPFISFLA